MNVLDVSIFTHMAATGESADAYGWQRSEWRTSRECSTGAADTSFAVAGDVGCHNAHSPGGGIDELRHLGCGIGGGYGKVRA